MSFTTFDLETGTKGQAKRKASPFNMENKIVAFAYKRDGGEVIGSYSKDGTGHQQHWFELMLEGTKILVGQNIKFDLQYVILRNQSAYKAWMKWVADGGLVWDTQLAEYLLCAQEQSSHMLSMDELVERYGGDYKIDEVKELWAAGVDTPDIPEDLLMRYLCGETLKDGTRRFGDIENTEHIFKCQLKEAKKRGQVASIMLNMGSLICTTEMEKNGMAVDEAIGQAQAKVLKEECDALRAALHKYLPKNLPFPFNWGSGKQLSALIFGGVVEYEAKAVVYEDDGKPAYYLTDSTAYLLKDGGEILFPHEMNEETREKMIAEGAFQTFEGGKKKGMPKTRKVKVPDIARGAKERMEKFLFKFDRMTEPKPEWETKNKGVYATNADIIDELAPRGIPFLDDLRKLNKKFKDLTTYYITYDEEKKQYKGMLTLVVEGIIHGSLNHTSTVTGRFSSSNPNLQNIPRADTSEVKKMFISRFGADGWMVQSDFSSLEVYVQALLTGDKQMIKDLQAKLDMHCLRVSAKFKIPYEEAVYRCKKDKAAPDFKLWKSRRTGCKEFSFQRAFGAGVFSLVESTGMSEQDIIDLIEDERKRYPGIDRYYDKVTEEIKANRVPSGKVVYHPEIKGLQCFIGKSTFSTPDGKRYSYREYPAPKNIVRKTGISTSFSPPEIKNYVVQGTGGEFAKAAMWLAVRAFYARENFGGLALLVNQVHDAVYVDSHKDVFAEASALLHACMEEASTLIEQRFNWRIDAPVPSETNAGSSMYEEKECPELIDNWDERVLNFKSEIRELYLKGYVPLIEREAA